MKIALIGYGKMGKAIEQIAIQRGHSVVLKVNSASQNWEKKLGIADVAIEFTRPNVALENFDKILAKNIPLVTGTTGWDDDFEKVKTTIENTDGAFLYASNFSLGVNLFFEINRIVAKIMGKFPEYEVEINETHHTQKLDAPSGTAISIAKDIISNQPNKKDWYCPQGNNQEEVNQKALKITAHREENVPGTHCVSYSSAIDEIKIVHEAKSREGFALGAVLAAEYLRNKKGVFTMKDVLDLQ